MKRVYLDYAATAPMRDSVKKAMVPYFATRFGNPGSLHSFGQEAMGAIDTARETVASVLQCEFRNIIFTGSATEANNLLISGIVQGWKGKGIPKIIISAIEHESILQTAKNFEAQHKATVCILPVDTNGVVRIEELKKNLDETTALVSVMYINNEIGTVQPIREISRIISTHRASSLYPVFHTDAVQAFQYFDCTPGILGCDYMTISAHKLGGPKGVGVLYGNNFSHIVPLISGGGQEFGIRSGTENVPAIVGCAVAIREAAKERVKEAKRIRALKKALLENLKKLFPDLTIHGPDSLNEEISSPHIVNVGTHSISAEEFLVQADLLGIAASSGAACSARSHAASHVLRAIGCALGEEGNGIRFSIGFGTKKEDVMALFSRLKDIFYKEKQ